MRLRAGKIRGSKGYSMYSPSKGWLLRAPLNHFPFYEPLVTETRRLHNDPLFGWRSPTVFDARTGEPNTLFFDLAYQALLYSNRDTEHIREIAFKIARQMHRTDCSINEWGEYILPESQAIQIHQGVLSKQAQLHSWWGIPQMTDCTKSAKEWHAARPYGIPLSYRHHNRFFYMTSPGYLNPKTHIFPLEDE